jgi:hypothetical protein
MPNRGEIISVSPLQRERSCGSGSPVKGCGFGFLFWATFEPAVTIRVSMKLLEAFGSVDAEEYVVAAKGRVMVKGLRFLPEESLLYGQSRVIARARYFLLLLFLQQVLKRCEGIVHGVGLFFSAG